jgi:hypothetical protein
LIVLPRRYPLPPIALPGGMKYQQGGVAMASHIGQSEEFVSLREYRHGDPPRHISERFRVRPRQGVRPLPRDDAGCRAAPDARAAGAMCWTSRCGWT